MLFNDIKISRFSLVWFGLLALSLTTNHPLFLHFRVIDFLLMSFVTYAVFSAKLLKGERFLCTLFIIFFFLAIVSSSLKFSEFPYMTHLVFYYKYFIFLSVLTIYSLCEEKFRNEKLAYSLVVLLLLYHIFYILYFLISIPTDVLYWQTRVSIPFSSLGYKTSNAPAYSLVFALFAVFIDRNASARFKLVLLPILLLAVLMCGSRTGVSVLLIYVLLFKVRFEVYSLIKWTSILFIAAVLFSVVSIYTESSLIERSLNFNLINDVSSNARISKLVQAFDSIEYSYYLLGVGHENTSTLWYDGLVSNVVVFSGLIGLFVFFFILYLCFRRMSVSIYFLLLVIASIISEFFLLSFLVGFALLLSITENSLNMVYEHE